MLGRERVELAVRLERDTFEIVKMRVDDESQPDEAANDLAVPAAMTGFVRGGSDQGDVKPARRAPTAWPKEAR